MSAPVIPESAPFTTEQRHWLNGYLAGLANGNGSGLSPEASRSIEELNGHDVSASHPAAEGPSVLILYGSQSGNAEGLAHQLAQTLCAAGTGSGSLRAFRSRVLGMDKYREVAWAEENAVLLLSSTWGDGDMPDNALEFWEWLSAPEAPSLDHLHYAVLGLGDRNYSRFCQAGKNLDGRFHALGAQRLLPLCECDTDYEDPAAAWMEAAFHALEKTPIAGKGPETERTGLAVAAINGHKSDPPKPAEIAPPASAFGKQNPFPAVLLENHPLNARGSAKDTRHLSLSLLDSGLEYKAGDALGVYGKNSYELVDRIILGLNCLGNEKVTFAKRGGSGQAGTSSSLRAALIHDLDLRRAPLSLLRTLRAVCRNPWEMRRLDRALSEAEEPATKAWLEGGDVLDVLEAYPHTRLDAQQLVDCLGKLAPRLYSISSSPKENPGEVHLTVGVVRETRANRMRRGVCSTYLAERVPLGMPVPVFVQASSNFSLPTASGVPIIMVGPGTGIAPFRAFLQERRCTGDTGKNWLFFGDQRRRYDFLYSEEFVAWQTGGFLSETDLAFSRDQEEKIYLQHLMLAKSRRLWDWLENGAHFYVCGDAKRMAKDVDGALHAIVEKEGGLGPDKAKEYVTAMKADKRYQRDVY